jgi:hypothetical protein
MIQSPALFLERVLFFVVSVLTLRVTVNILLGPFVDQVREL